MLIKILVKTLLKFGYSEKARKFEKFEKFEVEDFIKFCGLLRISELCMEIRIFLQNEFQPNLEHHMGAQEMRSFGRPISVAKTKLTRK